jgi:hypothetical protein
LKRPSARPSPARRIAEVIRHFLEQGDSVEIEGLGTFRKNAAGKFEFLGESRPRVFLAYAAEDAAAVERLYDAVESAGFAPWMDRRKLLPGQHWRHAIHHAIQTSSYFIACFSSRAIRKRGGFQAELRFALEYAREIPLGDIFLIPARLDACEVPPEIRRDLQYADLFPDFESGAARIIRAIRRQERARLRDAA